MLEQIASAVRNARAAAGLAVEELAKGAEVPEETLRRLEDGLAGMTTAQLERIAHALSVEFTALLQGRSEPQPVPSVFLKHTSFIDFDDRDSVLLDEALEQGRALATLRKLVEGGEAPLLAGPFQHRAVAGDQLNAPALDGYRGAREVRQWLGVGLAELGDLRQILEERFCIAVVVAPMVSARVTAVSVRAGAAAAVILNDRDRNRRNPLVDRVSLAHELCHVLFDPSAGGIHLVLDTDVDPKANFAEQRARAFAAELLLPVDGLTELLGPPARQRQLSTAKEFVQRARSHFGTPHEIAANHLCNQQFVDKSLREWLEVAKTTFEGKPPHTSVPRAGTPSALLHSLSERAHREGLLTDSETRGLLGLDPLAPLPWDEVEL